MHLRPIFVTIATFNWHALFQSLSTLLNYLSSYRASHHSHHGITIVTIQHGSSRRRPSQQAKAAEEVWHWQECDGTPPYPCPGGYQGGSGSRRVLGVIPPPFRPFNLHQWSLQHQY